MSDPQEPLRRLLDNQTSDSITSQTEQELRRRQVEIVHEYSLKIIDAELLDKQRELVMEFLKAILFLVTGGVGGYSLKTVRDKSEAPKSP